MKTLDIPNFPDDLYEQLEKLARVRGVSVGDVATELLAKRVAEESTEARLMDEIRVDRDAMAERGVWVTEEDVHASKNWGRE